MRAEEVAEIVHADDELPAVPDGEEAAHAGGGLDRAGVQRAVHDARRLVMLRARVDVPPDAGAAAVLAAGVAVDHQAQGLHERTQGHVSEIQLRHSGFSHVSRVRGRSGNGTAPGIPAGGTGWPHARVDG